MISIDGKFSIDTGDGSHNWEAHGFTEDIRIIPGMSDQEKFLFHVPQGLSKYGVSYPSSME